ncbi:MAG TPA: hypothetical protein VE544_12255 [Nitrososphaeraceae archaeon]|nr:hypothetical protein [Nitrososphaeraceae archaeon]
MGVKEPLKQLKSKSDNVCAGSIKVAHYCSYERQRKNKPLGAGIARTIAPNSGNDLSLRKEFHHESHKQ